jgi:hypothetical protein
MAKPLELRKVIRILRRYGVVYVTGKGRHPKFYDPESPEAFEGSFVEWAKPDVFH